MKVTRSSFKSVLMAAALALTSAAALRAQSSGPSAPVPHGTVALLSDVPSIRPNSDFLLAFHFMLEPGWHIYWTNPGDSGEPPRLIWQLPAGVKSGAIEWPAPKMLPMPGVMDFGYTGDVALLVPMHVAALASAKQADLAVQLKLVVCRDLCVPGSAQLSLRLPVASSSAAQLPGQLPAQTAGLFSAARGSLPKPAPTAWKIRAQQTKDDFVLELSTGQQVTKAAFFPLEEEQIDNAAPQAVESTPQGFRIHLKKADNLSHPVPRLRGVVEIPQGAFSVDAPLGASLSKSPEVKSSAAKNPS